MRLTILPVLVGGEAHMEPLVKFTVKTSAVVSQWVRNADGLRAKQGDNQEK